MSHKSKRKPDRLSQKRGPKPKLIRAKAEAILERVRGGQFLVEAIRVERIGSSSFYRGIEAFPEIRDALKGALAKQQGWFKQEAISVIRAAFEKDWKAAAWFLERKYPAEYGRVRHELNGPVGGPIATQNAQIVIEIPDNGRGDTFRNDG